MSNILYNLKVELANVSDLVDTLEKDVMRLAGIRRLLGHVQDGSDTVVTLSQDDATHTYHIRVGKREYSGDGFYEALDKAIADIKEDE